MFCPNCFILLPNSHTVCDCIIIIIMQHSNSTKSIPSNRNNRTNSLKLQKLLNHQQKLQQIRQGLNSQSRSNNHSSYSNNSFNKQSLITKLNPIDSKSSQRIIIPRKLSNPFLDPAERKKLSKLNTEQVEVEKKEVVKVSEEVEELSMERMVRKYLSNLMRKHYDSSLTIVEHRLTEKTKIKLVWWNLLATILQNISKSIKGNLQLCAQLSLAYLHIQEEIIDNEKAIIALLQDTNHQALLAQSFYFQRILVLFPLFYQQALAERQLSSLLTESVKSLLAIMKYISDILSQTQSHLLRYNKLKKPSYLIREKKLIQINRVLFQLKDLYARMKKLMNLGRLIDYQVKSPCTYNEILSKFSLLKKDMLDIPIVPFIENLSNQKYLCMINPQNIFFLEDKKNACIIFRPYAQQYIDKLSKYCEIVFIFHRKIKAMHPFVKEIEYCEAARVFDSSYYMYRETKKLIDLGKFGPSMEKIVVLDSISKKAYPLHQENCIHIDPRAKPAEYIVLLGRLIQMMAQSQPAQSISLSLNPK